MKEIQDALSTGTVAERMETIDDREQISVLLRHFLPPPAFCLVFSLEYIKSQSHGVKAERKKRSASRYRAAGRLLGPEKGAFPAGLSDEHLYHGSS